MQKTDRSPTAATPARPKTLRRRRELLVVVYDCIAQYGIDGVSMRQIAEAAKISTGTINYHFENKHNLIIAALEAAYRLPHDWESYRGSPLGQLKRLAAGHVLHKHTHERFWRFWLNYVAHSGRDEEMRRHLEQREARQQKFWTALVRDGVAAGELRVDIDPERTAERLQLIAHGLVVRQVQAPGAAARVRAREVLEEFFAEIVAPNAAQPVVAAPAPSVAKCI
ncbi:MAG: TetR family transcriptional regulator C-terminal domain-containing protein [Phenylobacterium sp.]|uniref:TetR/AcrR family transcriptional regulator n=1 Tax=Phenylobacterium sp. TaxID=1871053 RepID=UPI002736B525|nr:TetR family transcriptional regulator C-terminal domain-containing protein [Phenylobacterium sp.]MDP3175029.1 TetR family transcriptional regulator C-terminal domain-containing protein [Phenylobacterium sp.]